MWEKFLTLARRVPIRWIVLALAIIAGLLWLRFAPPTAPWSPRSVAGYVLPEPKVIVKIEKEIVPGPVRIKVVPKDRIITVYKDLPTPATVSDPSAQVTAVADIPPSPDGGVALAVLRPGADNVGVGTIEYRPASPKLFQVKREMGIRAGWGTEGIIGELYVRPVRVGPMEIEGRAYGRSGNGKSDFGAAVMADWKF